jgi:hypothetical protein
VLGDEGADHGVAQRDGEAVHRAGREELQRRGRDRQQQRHRAAQENRYVEAALEAEAVGQRAHDRLEQERDHRVERDQEADLGPPHVELAVGVERQRDVDDAEAQPRQEALGDDRQEDPLGLRLLALAHGDQAAAASPARSRRRACWSMCSPISVPASGTPL